MAKREIRIGLIGFGAMGKTHTYAVQNLPLFLPELPFTAKIVGVCTRSMEKSKKIADTFGFPIATDSEDDLIRRADVDVIDICTPNTCHYQTALRALAAGKHLYCEKPLCANAADALALAERARESGRICTTVFNNRHLSAVMRAKQLIDEGRLGRILHFDFSYLHNSCTDPSRSAGWKQDATVCGEGGVLFDLGSHILDLAVFLCGKFRSISGKGQIAFPHRLGTDGKPWRTDAPEAFYMMAETVDGAHGMLTASKLSTGVNDDLTFAVYGTRGSLRFSLMDLNYLEFYDNEASASPLGGERGFTRIECVGRYDAPAGTFPSPKAATGWLRGHLMSMYHFLRAVDEGRQNAPDFDDGAYIQHLMELALQSSHDGLPKAVTL